MVRRSFTTLVSRSQLCPALMTIDAKAIAKFVGRFMALYPLVGTTAAQSHVVIWHSSSSTHLCQPKITSWSLLNKYESFVSFWCLFWKPNSGWSRGRKHTWVHRYWPISELIVDEFSTSSAALFDRASLVRTFFRTTWSCIGLHRFRRYFYVLHHPNYRSCSTRVEVVLKSAFSFNILPHLQEVNILVFFMLDDCSSAWSKGTPLPFQELWLTRHSSEKITITTPRYLHSTGRQAQKVSPSTLRWMGAIQPARYLLQTKKCLWPEFQLSQLTGSTTQMAESFLVKCQTINKPSQLSSLTWSTFNTLNRKELNGQF